MGKKFYNINLYFNKTLCSTKRKCSVMKKKKKKYNLKEISRYKYFKIFNHNCVHKAKIEMAYRIKKK